MATRAANAPVLARNALHSMVKALQRTIPNIPELHECLFHVGMKVILQHERAGFADAVFPRAGRLAFNGYVILHQDAVVQNGEGAGSGDLSGCVTGGGVKDDVVALPFAGFAANIDQRNVLAVKGGAASVRIGWVFEGIENLDFVVILNIDAAVTASLRFCVGHVRGAEFDVDLGAAEFAPGIQVAFAAVADQGAVFKLPFGMAAVFVDPFAGVGSIEKDDGVRGWRAGRSGVHDAGLGPVLRAGGGYEDGKG